jgi:CDP-glycerol glycerophosphotransferase
VPSEVRLSVVVPVYNARDSLPECLDSIGEQDVPGGVQVVVVDDGSTDGSAVVASEYARRYPGFTLLTSPHAGPGPARNLGVQHSAGQFLAFADADDVVVPGAYRLMVDTLLDSGSDFAVGSVRRLVDGRQFEPPFLQEPHRRRRLGIRIDDLPEILRNVFAWNKVFRASFWNRAALAFPTGRMGEDQVTMTEAYLRAEAFDVLPKPVYVWRTRTGGSSITQQRHQLADLQDRIATKQQTTDLVTALGSSTIREYWGRNGLGGDLPLYFRSIPTCDDDYWRCLVTGLGQLFAGQPPVTASQVLRVQHRVVAWLVLHDRRSEAETMMSWLEEHPGPLPLQVEDDHVVARLPYFDQPDSGIPPQLFWLADHELRFDARLLSVRRANGALEVTGVAVIRGAPSSGVTSSVGVLLRSEGSVDTVGLSVELRPAASASEWVGRLPQRYDDGRFVAKLDLAQLRVKQLPSRWEAELTVSVGGIRRTGRFRSKRGDAGLPLTVAGPPAVVTFERETGLVITVTRGA